MKGRLDRKRLASAGGASIGVSVGAVILGALGVLIEPVARVIHSAAFDSELGLFASGGFSSYLSAYSVHILLFAASALMLAVAACCYRRRRLGFEFALSAVLLPLVLFITSAAGIADASARGKLYTAPATVGETVTDTYMIRFDEAAAELFWFLPAVVSALLCVTGIIILVRVLRSDFSADTPKLEEDYGEDEDSPTETE